MRRLFSTLSISFLTTLFCLIKLNASEPISSEDINVGFSAVQVELSNILKKEYPVFSNLLANGSFETADFNIPHSWDISNAPGMLWPSDKKIGDYSLYLMVISSGAASQEIEDIQALKGEKIAFGAWVKTSISEEVKLIINDGVSQYESDPHSGSNEWEFLTLKAALDENATQLIVSIDANAMGAVYIDGATLYQLTKDFVFTENPDDDIKMPTNLIYTDIQNKRVGINTNLPQEALEVDGNIKATGVILSGDNETLTQTSADSFYVNQSGDTMTGGLTVQGNISATGNLIVDSYIQAEKFLGDGSELTNLPLLWSKTEGTSDIYYEQGKVGIGTVSPYSSLQVETNGNWKGLLVGSNADDTTGVHSFFFGGARGETSINLGKNYNTTGDPFANDKSPSAYSIGYTVGSDKLIIRYVNGYWYPMQGLSLMTFKSNGYVGIGADEPSEKLEVSGNVKAAKFIGDGSELANLPEGGSSQWTTSGNDIYYNQGNIGIGTDQPTRRLHIKNGSLRIENPDLYKASYDTFWAAGVFVSGNYAYVADGGSGLLIIDISDLNSLTLTGSYNTDGTAHDVFVSGNYAYVADESRGLKIIDITNPATPTLIGNYDLPDYTFGLFVSGNYAYVASQSGGLQIIDVSDPSSPSLAGSYEEEIAWGAIEVFVSGNYAYVADYSSGLLIIDVSNLSSPSLVGNYDTPSMASDVFVSGNYAYVTDLSGGLQIIDVSNPASPTLAGSYDTSGRCEGVFVSGNYAYVADGSSGLLVIDVSNPSSPNLDNSYDTPDSAQGVFVSGNYAYIADSESGLQIFNVGGAAITVFGDIDISNKLYVRNGLDATGDALVSGELTATKFIGNGSGLTNLPGALWSKSGSNIYYDQGNVAIGTMPSEHELDIDGSINISENSGYKQNGGTILAASGSNIFLGGAAGMFSSGDSNTFAGTLAGFVNSGSNNSFFGYQSGANSTGDANSFFGGNSGFYNTTGNSNTFIGYGCGNSNTEGADNTLVGYGALRFNTTGDANTVLGYMAGYNNIGSGNVFIGYKSGFNQTGSNKLYIANNADAILIYGDFSTGSVQINGTLVADSIVGPVSGSINAADVSAATFGANTGGGDYGFSGSVYISGDMDVSGNIAAKYQDVAEWVVSSQRLMPATVVSLDPNNLNQVIAAKIAYDLRVAGVVSEQPGLILGEAGEGKYAISHSGRVKTKVTTKNGAIEVGDLLVTSSEPGVAMKSKPIDFADAEIHRPGTILGKALEPLEEGEGEILVLLSLQ